MATAAQLRGAYNAAIKALGVPYLSHNDPRLVMLYRAAGGISDPAAAQAAAQEVADLRRSRGYDVTDAELDAILNKHRAPMGSEQDFAALPGVGAAIRQGYGDITQARGYTPGATDPQVMTLIQGAVPNLTQEQAAQIARMGHDYAALTGTVIPDYAVDQYAGQVKGYHLPLPHQMDPGTFDAIQRDPVSKGLFEGALGQAGWDVGTYYTQHRASRPVGTAGPTASIGRQFAGVY
jgi:hypothetical protein